MIIKFIIYFYVLTEKKVCILFLLFLLLFLRLRLRFRKILGRRVIVWTYKSSAFAKRQITFIKVFPFVTM